MHRVWTHTPTRVASESPKPNSKTFKKKLKLKVAGERAGHSNFFIFYIQKNENGHCNARSDGTNARVIITSSTVKLYFTASLGSSTLCS